MQRFGIEQEAIEIKQAGGGQALGVQHDWHSCCQVVSRPLYGY